MQRKPINRRGVGSIFKDCEHDWGRCKCEWKIRYRDHSGRQREESGFPNQTKSWARLESIKEDKKSPDKRKSVEDERFGPYADTWLNRRRKLSQTSVGTYETIIRTHLKYILGEARRLRAITRTDLFSLVATLVEAGLHPSYISQIYYNVLVPILRSAAHDGLMDPLELQGIELPKIIRQDRYCPTPDEVNILINGVPEKYKTLLLIMAGCGLRLAESLAVSEKCFIGNGTLRVSEQWTENNRIGPLKHREPKQFRDVPLPSTVERQVGIHRESGLVTPKGYFFPSPTKEGALLHGQSVRDRINALIEKDSRLNPGITPHSLRHFFATEALTRTTEDGEHVDITQVAKWLGHQNIQLTYEIYGHLVVPSFDKVRAIMDSALAARHVPTK